MELCERNAAVVKSHRISRLSFEYAVEFTQRPPVLAQVLEDSSTIVAERGVVRYETQRVVKFPQCSCQVTFVHHRVAASKMGLRLTEGFVVIRKTPHQNGFVNIRFC